MHKDTYTRTWGLLREIKPAVLTENFMDIKYQYKEVRSLQHLHLILLNDNPS